ncbi:hypothetical protein Tco_1012038 [Tanacetum coccineum]
MTQRQSVPDATGDLWVERVVSVNGVPWVGDGGVSSISMSKESSIDEKNGEVAGSGGETVSISVVSTWVVGGITESVVSGIVPNKITRPADVLTLSSDESKETKITEIAMNYTSKSFYKYPLYQPCMMRK